MKILYSIQDVNHFKKNLPATSVIGFIPTMGALHDGHFSLFTQSLQDNDITIGSIYVNPTQFNNKEDLEKYPNTLEQDIEALENLGVDAVFIPSTEDIYPDGEVFDAIDLQGLGRTMEGAYRGNHFKGVTTVVNRLFSIIQPHKAYFGEKDFQQLQIIRKMVETLNLPIQIVGMPIIRKKNGLAMSSRNDRLSPQQKEDAAIIYRTLTLLQEKSILLSPEELRKLAISEFENSSLSLEYCAITDVDTLLPVEKFSVSKNYRAFIAAYCGEIRLIDNIELL